MEELNYIGIYIPNNIRNYLKERAEKFNRSSSSELRYILYSLKNHIPIETYTSELKGDDKKIYFGFYVEEELKDFIRERAKENSRSISSEILFILKKLSRGETI